MTTDIQLLETDKYAEYQKVVNLLWETKNPTQISKELGIPRKQVLQHIEEWRAVAANSEELKGFLTDRLGMFSEKMVELENKAVEIYDQAEMSAGIVDADKSDRFLGQMNKALALRLQIQKDAIDVLQKAGLFEAAEIGDEFAEQEAKMEALGAILEDVVKDCPHCNMEVKRRLMESGLFRG